MLRQEQNVEPKGSYIGNGATNLFKINFWIWYLKDRIVVRKNLVDAHVLTKSALRSIKFINFQFITLLFLKIQWWKVQKIIQSSLEEWALSNLRILLQVKLQKPLLFKLIPKTVFSFTLIDLIYCICVNFEFEFNFN